jgi:Methyltransferase domain
MEETSLKGITDEVWALIDKQPGWCWRQKAELIYRVASEPQVKVGVEIGVFGGRSLLPLCMAILSKGGSVFGFDVYKKHRTTSGQGHQEWWDKLDFARLEADTKDLLEKYGGWKDIIHKTSSAVAVMQFENDSVQFIHIDGSHRTWDAMQDIVLWELVLAPGGYMLLDDTNLEELQPVLGMLKYSDLEKLETLKNPVDGKSETQLWRKKPVVVSAF